jgi:basic amino acid/polyamine antiporter, APA family
MKDSPIQLRRDLTLTNATALVIGTIIGTGIFLKTAVMTQQLGSPALVLAAWGVAGLLTLAGALTFAELAALLPEAGGEYLYLRTAYGDAPAFLFGWTRYVVGGSSVAAYGSAFAIFLSALLPFNHVWATHTFHLFGQQIHWQFGTRQIVAVVVILFFATINCFGVAFGGRVQTLLTAAKVAGIGIIIAGAFFLSPNGTWAHLQADPTAQPIAGLSTFGAAMLGALWAFSGWQYLPMAAGEVREPGRNLPRGDDHRHVGRAGCLLANESGLLLRAAVE